MAQKISKEQYEFQSTEYTKKALAELNEQLKNFNRKDIAEEYNAEIDSENSSDEEHAGKERIIIETKAPKRKRKDDVHFTTQLMAVQERKLKDVQERLKSEEKKSHYLMLDLSNTKCELDVANDKLKRSNQNFADVMKIRFYLMFYLVLINVFLLFTWYSSPVLDKILFSPFTLYSIYTSWSLKKFFYKFRKL